VHHFPPWTTWRAPVPGAATPGRPKRSGIRKGSSLVSVESSGGRKVQISKAEPLETPNTRGTPRACLKNVASAILADVEPGFQPGARDLGAAPHSITPTILPDEDFSGRQDAALYGRPEARRYIFRQAPRIKLQRRGTQVRTMAVPLRSIAVKRRAPFGS